MAHARINPRLAKLHRCYSVDEAAQLCGVHKNTVRAWLKEGLPAIDGQRPVLIQGTALRSFLGARRRSAKRPCPAGYLYCFKCRAPRRPALGMADYLPREGGAGNLRALCEGCGGVMFRRARPDALTSILPGIEVRTVQAPPRIAEPAPPCLNSD